ncbi:MAG TPA: hypothetical protein PLO89_00930 [Spirochaetota bacterium]|nr:hypothetical protein [Spirochaetota bacterium]
MKKCFFLFLLFFVAFFSFSDESEDKREIGSKFYSGNSFYASHSFEFGVSGSKDFFTEYFLFSYRFKSRNKHSFTIRTYHIGYAPGIFSNNFSNFNFAVMGGFEYLFKIFSKDEGLFLFFDAGGCNNGFAFNAGIGIGSRVRNGFEINFCFLQNVMFFSRLDFYFLVFDFLILKGKLGFDLKYYNYNIELFTFLVGMFIGFSVKEYFRIELGGGLTINDYAYYSGFGSFSLVVKVPK